MDDQHLDRELLAGLRAGQSPAFDAIFRAYYSHLVSFAQSLLHDRGSAEDVAQDVMLELWRRRDALAIHESLRAYLLRATARSTSFATRTSNGAPNRC